MDTHCVKLICKIFVLDTLYPMASKKQTRKTYGRRAAGKTQTTISLSDEALAKAKKNAESDGRSFSNYIEQLINKAPLLLLGAFCLFHLTRSPRAWNAAALKATASAAWGHVQRIAR
jgi:hypothetical protein